jgi:hypothetical protein
MAHTKKDYEATAAMIRAAMTRCCTARERSMLYAIAVSLGAEYRDSNSAFKMDKFIAKCFPEGFEDSCVPRKPTCKPIPMYGNMIS